MLWLRRRAWLLSLAGFALGAAAANGLWAAILLDASFLPSAGLARLSPKSAAAGLALALVPWAWLACLRLEMRLRPRLDRIPLAPLLALCLFAAAELAFRSFPAQAVFWQSVLARAGNQHQAREIALLRSEAAAVRRAGPRAEPGIVLLGSSQIVHGIDVPSLAAQTGLPVYRRAASGMFPSEIVAGRGFYAFNPSNRLAVMLSGFDLGARRDLYPDAIRPLATPSGLRTLFPAASPSFLLPRWRMLADLSAAAASDLWRSRDHARFLLEHPFAPASLSPSPKTDAALLGQRAAYENLGENPQMVSLCLDSLDRFFTGLSPLFREIVVFEGQVNPAYSSPTLPALSASMRSLLADLHRRRILRFVPLEEQALDLPPSAWKDMTHVGPEGRRLYTQTFARFLSLNSPALPDPAPSAPGR